MEYENCPGGSSIARWWPVIAMAFILAVLIIIIVTMPVKTEKFGDREDEIMTALAITIKQGGTIMDFKTALKDPKFSPTKYIHLADKYRQNALTKADVTKIMNDPAI